ncbi:hypothetical protein IIA16_01355 [bacterium]|nr:hypothetical protein [bacterium]
MDWLAALGTWGVLASLMGLVYSFNAYHQAKKAKNSAIDAKTAAKGARREARLVHEQSLRFDLAHGIEEITNLISEVNEQWARCDWQHLPIGFANVRKRLARIQSLNKERLPEDAATTFAGADETLKRFEMSSRKDDLRSLTPIRRSRRQTELTTLSTDLIRLSGKVRLTQDIPTPALNDEEISDAHY